MIEKIKYYIARTPNIPKTLLFNFYYLPLNQALHFPIFVAGNVKIKHLGSRDAVQVKTNRRGFVGIGTSKGPYNLSCKQYGYWNVEDGASVVFDGKCVLGSAVKIDVGKNAILHFGEDVSMNVNCLIVAHRKVVLGKDDMCGWDCTIMDTDAHMIFDREDNTINEPKEINIGNHVWIGEGCTVLKGSKIANDSVVAAKSVVAKEFGGESNVVIAGNPARIVKRDIVWKRELYG